MRDAATATRPAPKRVVITGVNLVEGGTLTAFRHMVHAMATAPQSPEVVALVHRPGLLGVDGVIEIAFPAIKRSWLRRLWFEWVELASLSRRLGADVWISMHDITPRVRAPRQFVYCHNPSPFARVPWRQTLKDRTFAAFRLLYALLYGIRMSHNTAVIVQQQWLRDEFVARYRPRQVIVAHPVRAPAPRGARARTATGEPSLPTRRFLYPTLPRVFKNIELIGEALTLLDADPRWRGSVSVTIDGSEGSYARGLVGRFGGLRSLRFIGRQAHDAMDRCYNDHDALIFPSLLETWGLPLTEARDRGMPLLAADLPYAHEAVGDCDAVRFFDPRRADALAELLLALSEGRTAFETHRHPAPAAPFAPDWSALCQLLLGDSLPGRADGAAVR